MVLTFVYSRIKAMHGCFASEAAIIMCNNSPLYTLIICPNLLEIPSIYLPFVEIDQGTYSVTRRVVYASRGA
jgi:hypothetical protein